MALVLDHRASVSHLHPHTCCVFPSASTKLKALIRKVLIAAFLLSLLSTFSPAEPSTTFPFYFMEETKLLCIQSILSVQKPGKYKKILNLTTGTIWNWNLNTELKFLDVDLT